LSTMIVMVAPLVAAVLNNSLCLLSKLEVVMMSAQSIPRCGRSGAA
jgi:hypothetical protein